MNLHPRYPTVTHKTVCEDINAYGTWYILKDDLSKEKEEEIKKLQDECLMAKKKLDDRFAPPVQNIRAPNIRYPLQPEKIDDKSYNRCINNFTGEFKKLNKYCRKTDKEGSHLDIINDAHLFCSTGKYNMNCVSPQNFSKRLQKGTCPNKEGLYLCKNGSISCDRCPFDRTRLESRLHQSFLNKKCKEIGGQCRSIGMIQDKNDVYKLRPVNRGFDERWFSGVKMLRSSDVGIIPTRVPDLSISAESNRRSYDLKPWVIWSHHGQDLNKNPRLGTVDECKKGCDETNGCVGFSWRQNRDPKVKGECWYKNNVSKNKSPSSVWNTYVAT